MINCNALCVVFEVIILPLILKLLQLSVSFKIAISWNCNLAQISHKEWISHHVTSFNGKHIFRRAFNNLWSRNIQFLNVEIDYGWHFVDASVNHIQGCELIGRPEKVSIGDHFWGEMETIWIPFWRQLETNYKIKRCFK